MIYNSRPLHRGCGLKFTGSIDPLMSFKGRPLHRGCGLKLVLHNPDELDSNRRPLHRGCGLKSFGGIEQADYLNVALFTEGVD